MILTVGVKLLSPHPPGLTCTRKMLHERELRTLGGVSKKAPWNRGVGGGSNLTPTVSLFGKMDLLLNVFLFSTSYVQSRNAYLKKIRASQLPSPNKLDVKLRFQNFGWFLKRHFENLKLVGGVDMCDSQMILEVSLILLFLLLLWKFLQEIQVGCTYVNEVESRAGYPEILDHVTFWGLFIYILLLSIKNLSDIVWRRPIRHFKADDPYFSTKKISKV